MWDLDLDDRGRKVAKRILDTAFSEETNVAIATNIENDGDQVNSYIIQPPS